MGTEIKREPAGREAKLDDMLDDTFPGSDPPSTTPPSGTRKSREIEAAHERVDHGPTGSPDVARDQTETAMVSRPVMPTRRSNGTPERQS